jgi:hypothetical protein
MKKARARRAYIYGLSQAVNFHRCWLKKLESIFEITCFKSNDATYDYASAAFA